MRRASRSVEAQRALVVAWFAVAIGCEDREADATDTVISATRLVEKRPGTHGSAILGLVKSEPAFERAPSDDVMAARADVELERPLRIGHDTCSNDVVHTELDTCALVATPAELVMDGEFRRVAFPGVQRSDIGAVFVGGSPGTQRPDFVGSGSVRQSDEEKRSDERGRDDAQEG
jgi:hypothetical protein